jgi:hypothetical protein
MPGKGPLVAPRQLLRRKTNQTPNWSTEVNQPLHTKAGWRQDAPSRLHVSLTPLFAAGQAPGQQRCSRHAMCFAYPNLREQGMEPQGAPCLHR